MAIALQTLDLCLTFLEPLLGTVPLDPELFENYAGRDVASIRFNLLPREEN